jgi:hypothetical protein
MVISEAIITDAVIIVRLTAGSLEEVVMLANAPARPSGSLAARSVHSIGRDEAQWASA